MCSVQSPSEFLNKKPQPPQPSVLDRRQSIAVADGISNNRIFPSYTKSSSPTPTPPPPYLLERKSSLQVTGVGEGQTLVDAMSARSSPGLADMAMTNNRDAHVRSVGCEVVSCVTAALNKLEVVHCVCQPFPWPLQVFS